MTYSLQYCEGHPAGYTDDLGIIADRNQWVEEEFPGWYCWIPRADDLALIRKWCMEYPKGLWYLKRSVLYLADEEDATLFRLVWG